MCKPKVKLRQAACCLNTLRSGRLRLPDLAVHRESAGEKGEGLAGVGCGGCSVLIH